MKLPPQSNYKQFLFWDQEQCSSKDGSRLSDAQVFLSFTAIKHDFIYNKHFLQVLQTISNLCESAVECIRVMYAYAILSREHSSVAVGCVTSHLFARAVQNGSQKFGKYVTCLLMIELWFRPLLLRRLHWNTGRSNHSQAKV